MTQGNNNCSNANTRFDKSFSQPNTEIEIPFQTSDLEPQSAITACPYCGGSKGNLVQMPKSCVHHAARRCGICDSFLGWQPKPENTSKRSQQQELISQLLESTRLSDWEHEFLQGLNGKRKLSPKQQEVLARIKTKLGGAQ